MATPELHHHCAQCRKTKPEGVWKDYRWCSHFPEKQKNPGQYFICTDCNAKLEADNAAREARFQEQHGTPGTALEIGPMWAVCMRTLFPFLPDGSVGKPTHCTDRGDKEPCRSCKNELASKADGDVKGIWAAVNKDPRARELLTMRRRTENLGTVDCLRKFGDPRTWPEYKEEPHGT